MRIFCFAVVFWLSSAVAGAAPERMVLPDVWEGMGLARAPVVELQGGIAKLTPAQREERIHFLRTALAIVRDLAPTYLEHHFFRPPHGAYADRGFSVVLTDSDRIDLGDRELFVGAESDAATVVGLSRNEDGHLMEDLTAFCRADRMLFDDQGRYRPHALHRFVVSLLKQVYAYWQQHLEWPIEEVIPQLQNAARFEAKVTGRAVRLFDDLLEDPRVVRLADGEKLRGILYGARVGEKHSLSHLTQSNHSPFVLPLALEWGLATRLAVSIATRDRAEALFWRALHLVESVPPLGEPTFFDGRLRSDPRLRQRIAIVHVMSPSDMKQREKLIGIPVVDLVEWMPSETFIAEGRHGGRFFSTVFWANQLLFLDADHLRPDALAELSTAMAAEFYGAYDGHLFGAAPLPRMNSLEMVEGRTRVLEHGPRFIARLQNHDLWQSLSDSEKDGFARVKAQYEAEQDRHSCVGALLRQRALARSKHWFWRWF